MRHSRGIALPVCLLLSGILLLMALSALRNAGDSALLLHTLREQQRAALLAQQILRAAYAAIESEPGLLPTAADALAVPHSQALSEPYTATTTVHLRGTDDHCPEFTTGTRRHYELVATLSSDQQLLSRRLGFAVCFEVCMTAGCVPRLAVPTRSYWSTGEPD